MSANADAANQVVNIVTEIGGKAVKVSAELTGIAAKQMGALLIAVLAQKNKTIGQKRLTNLLQQCDDLTIVSLDTDKYEDFKDLAKSYGIVYAVSQDKAMPEKTMIFVSKSQAERVNSLLERIGAQSTVLGEIKDIAFEEQSNIEDVIIPEVTWNDMHVDMQNIQEQLEENISLTPGTLEGKAEDLTPNELFSEMVDMEDMKSDPEMIYSSTEDLEHIIESNTSKNFTNGTSQVTIENPSEKKLNTGMEVMENDIDKFEDMLNKDSSSENTNSSHNIDRTGEDNRPSLRDKINDFKNKEDIAGNDKNLENVMETVNISITKDEIEEIAN